MNTLRINPPIYTLEAPTTCWKCGKASKAVALACVKAEETGIDAAGLDEMGGKGEPLILSDLTDVPQPLLDQMKAIQPHFEWRFSHTAGSSYWANVCPHCGSLFGDFFLHCEPGGAFFPEDDEAASQITIHELKVPGPVEVGASWGMGTGGFIFAKGRRVSHSN